MITREPTRPGQESVWDYPRPARAERTAQHLRIVHKGTVVAETRSAVRTLETSHPPSFYFPPGDVAPGVLTRSAGTSLCEWKGRATYFDVSAGGDILRDAAWAYPAPTGAFESLRDHVAFYPAFFEACFVDGERVTSQPGGFYGGWITSAVAGPFKGVPNSRFW